MTMTLMDRPEPTLPSHWYFDAAHYQRELQTIWYRDWVCVGREDALAKPGDYFTVTIGDQNIIVTRTSDAFRAFHNTCRHRGAQICSNESGHFRNGRIICPYHTWTYSVDGELLATPNRLDTGSFDRANYPLYDVNLETWRGFIFVNLAENPETTVLDQLATEADWVRNWPLEDMRSVHQVTKSVASNWKIYWENYSECYHCPRIHPALCHVMPVYKLGTSESRDIPGWTRADDGDAETWTPDGKSTLPAIEGLSDEEHNTIVTFASFTGMMYIAAHRDYVRTVRLLPCGPEKVELIIDWLLPSQSADTSKEALQPIIDFPTQVIVEDAQMCELNQKGLHSLRHRQGALVEQEYEIRDFHQWLRGRLGEP
ncbi:MAG TPA: aromatic ring-hydroxylating dioxygenase subunit alpha [Woeseiaceae bacterium]|nr:aromatic ring-hydroxylating dioxygenase subunit alpha [Woeseiaceae bacterium]